MCPDKCGISFANGQPIAHKNSDMKAIFGCSSMSDQDGNLLFYTNGKSVWNYNDQIRKNSDFASVIQVLNNDLDKPNV